MLKIIGKNNCDSCDMTIIKLKEFKIEFEYIKMEDMDKNLFKQIKKNAIKKGVLSFPIVILGDEYMTSKQLLDGLK